VHNLNSMADLAVALSEPLREDRLKAVKERAA
jgi:hypothetical protein